MPIADTIWYLQILNLFPSGTLCEFLHYLAKFTSKITADMNLCLQPEGHLYLQEVASVSLVRAADNSF